MSRESTLKRIVDAGIVAVVRSESSDSLVKVVQALAEGGVGAAEVTFTVPDAIEVIRQVRREVGDAIVLGAGTVLDSETARAALLAGAEYIVAPTMNLDVIRLCRRYDKAVMPGAFTPTEILAAWEAGADIVKVFPADVGGPAYLKAIRGPLPQIRLMPTGGVNLTTAENFLEAGACCLGVGSAWSTPKPSLLETSHESAASPNNSRPSSAASMAVCSQSIPGDPHLRRSGNSSICQVAHSQQSPREPATGRDSLGRQERLADSAQPLQSHASANSLQGWQESESINTA